MPVPLLATKLFIPPPGKNLVERSRLANKLDECLHPNCRLVLIAAPAGFGKSTLVCSWINALKSAEKSDLPWIAWLSVDEGDNDPILFWQYVLSSIQVQNPEIGKQTQSLMQLPIPPDLDKVLAILINDLSRVTNPTLLILDDFHHVRNPAIHKSLTYFLDHAPAQFHLMVLSRTDPPLPLALLRSRQQLLEIRMADLRFTANEAALFVNQIMQLVLSNKEIELLIQRTEGWIVGLQMAAISLKNQADQHAFISNFSGNDRYIADYLIEEVLDGQTQEIKRFLLLTSILDHLNAPLCDAVTGIQKSQEMLNALDKANLFIIPLDNHREWFRYHQLFAELLQHKLINAYGKKEVEKLEQRAVDWMVNNGHAQLAIEYALHYADYELAASLMTSYGQQFIRDSSFITILSLAEHLPEVMITQNVTLTCILTHSAMATGHMQMADHLIHNMEKQIGVSIDEFLQKGDQLELAPFEKAGLIELGVFQARTCVDTFHLDRTFYLSDHLLPYLTPEREREPFELNSTAELRTSLLFTLGLAHMMHGDVSEAAQIFIKSAAEAKQCHNLDVEILSLGHLGDAQALEGRLHDALTTYQQTLAATQEILYKTPFFGVSKAGMGNLYYEWNELEKAETYFRAAIEHGLWWRNWEILLPGYTGLARIHGARGDWEASLADLDDLMSNVQEKDGLVNTSTGSIKALVNLRRGNLKAAERWAEAYEPERSCDYMVEWEEDALVGCRVWIAGGVAERADRLLDRIIKESGAAGRNSHVLEALCIRSLLYSSIKNNRKAMAVLATALEMARPENYIRTFVDEGKAMAKLLVEAGRAGIQPEYARMILEAYTPSAMQVSSERTTQMNRQTVLAPLNQREIEILRLIADGYPNKEIAQKLCISLRTVKYHTTSIYTKLNASGRAQAVNIARELNLL